MVSVTALDVGTMELHYPGKSAIMSVNVQPAIEKIGPPKVVSVSTLVWRRRLGRMLCAGVGVFGVALFAGSSSTRVVWADSPPGAIGYPVKAQEAADAEAIRPFHISVPEEALVDLKRRIVATRWPEQELVPDATQGVQRATMQKLAQYWGTDYDWR